MITEAALVGVLMVSRGQVADVLIGTATDVLGPLERVASFCLESRPQEPEQLRSRLEVAVSALDDGAGVLMLADLCGSTLSNVCYDLARGRPERDVLCGMNLAMLTKLYSVDRSRVSATELARLLADSGRRGITVASDVLPFDERRGDE